MAVLLAIGAATLAAACGSPPQVVEIAPQRGAVDVRSNEPVRVRFDRQMDHASVAAHFHVEPRVRGSLAWASADDLTFEHDPFSPAAQYRVVLDSGYRDAQGSANPLRHSWTFRTESAPDLAGSTPGAGDRDIDPAAYISLTFSRQMDPGSLTAALGLSPAVPFAIHQDAIDPLRVVLAPQSLLESRTGYTVNVGPAARDIDGNHLGAASTVSFTTGDFRPLKHWIGFIAEATPGTGGAGVWVVNENRLPRPVVTSAVSSFTWSPDGTRLLLRSPAGTWTDQPLDGPGTTLPIAAGWADFLAPGRGYAFLDQGRLGVLRPDGRQVTVATGVTSAAVAPGGLRLAFTIRDTARSERASEIDGYDTELGTRYRLQSEPEPVDGLSWSPDGQSVAYRLLTADAAKRQVRARSLRDGGASTVATGDVSAPVWQADRQHVFFTASVPSPAGAVTRVFRFAVNDGTSHTLSPGTGMPAGQDVQVQQLSPSPDGHQLAFLGDADGRPGVWTMNADGTGVTRLTDADLARFPYSSRDVAWTPS